MIGYVLDGFPLFAHLDEKDKAPADLDECGGHRDEIRGYHYHAGAPGSNQIIKAFRGIPGTATSTGVSELRNHGGRPPRNPEQEGDAPQDHSHGEIGDHEHGDPKTQTAPKN